MINLLSQHYTSKIFSKLLINEMSIKNPKSVIDFGVGNGALTTAAIERWKEACFYASDIDKKNLIKIKTEYPFVNVIKVNHLTNNWLSKIKIEVGSIDVSICNPPFNKYLVTKDYTKLLNKSGLGGCVGLYNITSDIVFLAQNLLLLKSNGELGIILPDTLITNSNFKLFRKTILDNFYIKSIIQLPDNVFSKTEAQAFIVTIKKNKKRNNYIPIFLSNINGICNKKVLIKYTELYNRMDFVYHNWALKQKNKIEKRTIAKVNAQIIRGRYTRKDLDDLQVNFLHTNNLNNKLIKSKKNSYDNLNPVIAKKGDILIARVGKRSIGKVAMISTGQIAVSDCIIIIRSKNEYTSEIFRKLISFDGQEWFRAHAHGVCSKVISKTDLLNFPF